MKSHPISERRQGSRTPLPLAREALRALAALALYALLYPVWTWSGLAAAYKSWLLAVGTWIVAGVEHFPTVASTGDMSLENIDFAVLLAVCLFLVSWRIPWMRRLRLFGMLLGFILVWHAATAALEVRVRTASDLSHEYELLVLRPWEFKIIDRTRYLLLDLGVQAGPFALFVLAAFWNSRKETPPDTAARPEQIGKRGRRARAAAARTRLRRWRRRLTVAGVAAVVLLGAAFVWSWTRERDPEHLKAHVRLGELYTGGGQWERAKAQYRVAIDAGYDEPRVYWKLAETLARSGRRNEARMWLGRGLEATSDSSWQTRLREAIAEMDRAGVQAETGRAPAAPGRPTRAEPGIDDGSGQETSHPEPGG